jgi:Tol biopolymer transport system component
VASVADGHVDALSDLLAYDLEWSPDGSLLAISSAQDDPLYGESLRDGSIRLYDVDSGEMRTLVGPSGVGGLTWSPDAKRIAFVRGRSDGGDMDQETSVVRVDGSREEQLTRRRFGAIYGVGPVWSPTGDRIVYQRMKNGGTEAHDVVLVNPDDAVRSFCPICGCRGTMSRSPSGRTASRGRPTARSSCTRCGSSDGRQGR